MRVFMNNVNNFGTSPAKLPIESLESKEKLEANKPQGDESTIIFLIMRSPIQLN